MLVIQQGDTTLGCIPFFMSLNLATHLKTSRHGIFYFRMTIPATLRPRFGKNELVYSLHTRDPAKAKRLAYTLTSQTHILFGKMAYDPNRFNPFDVSTFPTADTVRPYELDLQRGIIKSDGAEDHARAMEALAMMKSIPQQAPAPGQVQYMEPQPAHTITLSKALEAWSKTLSVEKTRKTFASSIQRFITSRGDVEIHTIKPVDAVKWNALLLKDVSPSSADNRLQALQSLLKWGFKHEYIHHTAQLATEGKFNLTKTQRTKQMEGAEPFSVAELNQIFDLVAYTQYTTKNTKEKSDARYWMPFIALFTGMRLEEIAQLQTVDIQKAEGLNYFDVNSKGGKSLKTASAERKIPIHQTLIRLGFLDYVRGLKVGVLFPELKKTANGFGNPVSKAFIRHLEDIGVRKDGKGRTKVFHSFRDTFNNFLERVSSVTPEVRLTLMGHAQNGANAQNYTAQKDLQRLKNQGIDYLQYVETSGGITHTLKL